MAVPRCSNSSPIAGSNIVVRSATCISDIARRRSSTAWSARCPIRLSRGARGGRHDRRGRAVAMDAEIAAEIDDAVAFARKVRFRSERNSAGTCSPGRLFHDQSPAQIFGSHPRGDRHLPRARPQHLSDGVGRARPIGVFGTTKGLQKKHATKRVFDMPVAENAMTGVALGACLGDAAGHDPHAARIRDDRDGPNLQSAAKWTTCSAAIQGIITMRMIIGRGWGHGPATPRACMRGLRIFPGSRWLCRQTPKTPRACSSRASKTTTR